MKSFFKPLASLKITVAGLLLLTLQTVWGTFYQIENGLYQAQQHIFNPWVAWISFIPVPGTRLVLWVLLVNLIAATFFRWQWKASKTGIWIIHMGLILLVVSGGVTFHFARESQMTLREGEGRNTVADYHHWELAVWKKKYSGDTIIRAVESFDFNALNGNEPPIKLDQYPISLKLIQHFPNAAAFSSSSALAWELPKNSSGISGIEQRARNKDPAEDLPGVLFEVIPRDMENTDKRGSQVLLYGGDSKETAVPVGRDIYEFSLRHQRTELPFFIVLDDFIKEEHPGTQMARKYESFVTLVTSQFTRKIKIHMNHPLREAGYTFFQASFSQSQDGEASTLAVVKNPGRMMPYLSSLLVGLGLTVHFLMKLVAAMKKRKGA